MPNSVRTIVSARPGALVSAERPRWIPAAEPREILHVPITALL
jgi:hypothetical protein